MNLGLLHTMLVVIQHEIGDADALHLRLPLQRIVLRNGILVHGGVDAHQQHRHIDIVGQELRHHRRRAGAGTTVGRSTDDDVADIRHLLQADVDGLQQILVGVQLERILGVGAGLAGTVDDLLIRVGGDIHLHVADDLVDIPLTGVVCDHKGLVGDLTGDRGGNVAATIAAADDHEFPDSQRGDAVVALRHGRRPFAGNRVVGAFHHLHHFLVSQLCHS
nr:hypothetical protein [uncultured Duncaniella sp.]